MDSKKAKKISKEIIYNLEIVLSNKDLYSKVSTPEFRKNIVRQLSMLKQLFTIQKTKEQELFDIIDKFNLFLTDNKITGSEVVATNFKTEVEFTDEMNFLKVYIKNTFDRDFNSFSRNDDALRKISKLDETAPTLALEPSPSYDYEKSSSSKTDEQMKTAYQYGDATMWRERVKAEMVQKRIQEDYIKGNYYFFTSKPKIVPIMKKVFSIFTLTIGVIFLVRLILGIIVGSQPMNLQDKDGNIVSGRLGVDVFSITMSVFVSFTLIWSGVTQLKPVKNDNFKFTSSNFMYYMLFVLGVLSLISSIASIGGQTKFFDDLASWNKGEEWKVKLFIANWSLQIIVYSLLTLFIIHPIVYNIFKPQPNLELRQKLVDKYSKEIDDAGILN